MKAGILEGNAKDGHNYAVTCNDNATAIIETSHRTRHLHRPKHIRCEKRLKCTVRLAVNTFSHCIPAGCWRTLDIDMNIYHGKTYVRGRC